MNSNRQHDSVLVEHGRETEDATGSQVKMLCCGPQVKEWHNCWWLTTWDLHRQPTAELGWKKYIPYSGKFTEVLIFTVITDRLRSSEIKTSKS